MFPINYLPLLILFVTFIHSNSFTPVPSFLLNLNNDIMRSPARSSISKCTSSLNNISSQNTMITSLYMERLSSSGNKITKKAKRAIKIGEGAGRREAIT